eukprot:1848463-Prymnesium_polylepis.1
MSGTGTRERAQATRSPIIWNVVCCKSERASMPRPHASHATLTLCRRSATGTDGVGDAGRAEGGRD